MLERVHNPAIGYGAGFLFLALAVGLRWALDRAQGGLGIGLALVQGLRLDDAHAAPRQARSMDSTNDR